MLTGTYTPTCARPHSYVIPKVRELTYLGEPMYKESIKISSHTYSMTVEEDASMFDAICTDVDADPP